MVHGGLNDYMRTRLFEIAREMYLKKKEQARLKEDRFEAVVKTELKYSGIGSIYGVMFTAEIESDETGRTNAAYIVCTHDLEKVDPRQGFWMQGLSFEPTTAADKASCN